MIVCDTGPLVAVLNSADQDHQRCTDFLETHPGPLLVPSTVVTEVCFMVESRVGPSAEAAFLRSLATRELEFAELTTTDLTRMAELVDQHADLSLGATDASVIALAERLKLDEIATLDHRDFSVVRPRHIAAFRLLPD